MNIKDIARLAGVGVSTVSRVINDHPDVKDETREKILKIIKESNYIPNNSARILKKNNTNNIGVLVKGVFNPFFAEMINIIGNRINEAGYTMILQQNDYATEDDVDNLIAFVKEKRLQGIICLGGNFLNINDESFQFLDIPVVLTSVNTLSKESKSKFSSIGIDNVLAAKASIQYLIDKGHRNIGILLGEKNDVGISGLRLEGYKKALEENNIPYSEENVFIGDYDYSGAYRVTKEIINNRKDITAIFSISDIMAVGAAKSVIDQGLQVGEDISIMGFDGMDISKYYNPGITTVKQPKKNMANNSIDLLLALLAKKEDHKHIIFETKIIERESCKEVV
ncbi:TPA: LacI family DNA-binding transcriptional regulator [Clostridium perfringens]|jgi:LacI family transcriptional regulator|uniref:LacI family DNA-binding transcriptional regulator n=1 Tax=Clostridium perfringens TaxID=1502 RepID=UPI0013E3280B|nr:LacI family DNA-binding transcriptional regulator [Clostridium perfringens]EJT5931853.1 LacI family DNA-binding transcriptional regulator [Clostridium perfringens]EJT6163115.1 LacI family DNA-binding transcriptional regulator [Clostridium perfringens]EJT6505600.1 LacI family DNA-binding transcriptional regulator [Clostridium perfringens]MDK0591976.1 LacI family DNA-binding transcriptional regulator [Clostridium perfringens]MDK0594920.1 LacI family DNA-binding transcriptional regulator [Clos